MLGSSRFCRSPFCSKKSVNRAAIKSAVPGRAICRASTTRWAAVTISATERPSFLVQAQQFGDGGPHLAPGDDPVYKAVLLQVLRALEPLRQSLSDGLLDDPGAGKADEGPRLRQGDDIPPQAGAGLSGRRRKR